MIERHCKAAAWGMNFSARPKARRALVGQAMVCRQIYEGRKRERTRSIARHTTILRMAGAAGFEPAHAGTKNQCLTAWLRPNIVRGCAL